MPLMDEPSHLALPFDTHRQIMKHETRVQPHPCGETRVLRGSAPLGEKVDPRGGARSLVNLAKENEEVAELQAASGRTRGDLMETSQQGDQVVGIGLVRSGRDARRKISVRSVWKSGSTWAIRDSPVNSTPMMTTRVGG